MVSIQPMETSCLAFYERCHGPTSKKQWAANRPPLQGSRKKVKGVCCVEREPNVQAWLNTKWLFLPEVRICLRKLSSINGGQKLYLYPGERVSMPSGTCPDRTQCNLPCKHKFAIFRLVSGWSQYEWPPSYFKESQLHQWRAKVQYRERAPDLANDD